MTNVAKENQSLCDLPSEILQHIFGYLEYDDLIRLSTVNWRCHDIAHIEFLWKPICEKHWIVDEKSQLLWRETFCKFYKEYGRYIKLYPRIIGAWKTFKTFLQTHSPAIFESLSDKTDDNQLDLIEKEKIWILPDDLRLFFKACCGQKSRRHTGTPCPGLFGSLESVTYEGFMNWHGYDIVNFIPPFDVINKSSDTEYYLLDIALHDESTFAIVLPRKDGNHSTDAERVPPPGSVVWTTWTFGQRHVFAVAPTFEAWFLDFVEKTVSGIYPIQDGHILRYNYEPECVARTGSITVHAGWAYSRLLDVSNMLFEYRITLSMDEDADSRDSCQLLERHWIITHEKGGRQERVSGPGVVGEYPIMKPGTKYSWMSRTYFGFPGGSMGGHFTMRNLQTSDKIEIECPTYNMKFPHRYS